MNNDGILTFKIYKLIPNNEIFHIHVLYFYNIADEYILEFRWLLIFFNSFHLF